MSKDGPHSRPDATCRVMVFPSQSAPAELAGIRVAGNAFARVTIPE